VAWIALNLSLPFHGDPDFQEALLFHLFRHVDRVDVTTLDYGQVLIEATRETACRIMSECSLVRSIGDRIYSESEQAAFMTSRRVVVRSSALVEH